MSRSTALEPTVARNPAARIARPDTAKNQSNPQEAICRAVDTSLDQTVVPDVAGGN